MKGLDDYITGRFDPNNPANQVDWTEIYDSVLDKCDWITEKMLDDDDIHETLGNIIFDIHEKIAEPDKYFNRKEKHQFVVDNSAKMAHMLKLQYDFVWQYQNKKVIVKHCPIKDDAITGEPTGEVKNGYIKVSGKSYLLDVNWTLSLVNL